MKRLLIAVLAILAGFAVPSVAQASHPTASFADASLRGQTANAPDNDIKIWWDASETCPNASGGLIDVQSSAQISSGFPYPGSLPHFRRSQYRFYRAGGKTFDRSFDTWWASSTEYHDQGTYAFSCPAP